MADVARITLTGSQPNQYNLCGPSLDTLMPGPEHQTIGVVGATAIKAGDACYIASSGLVLPSDGTSANAAAKVRGFAAMRASVGEAVTLLHGCEMNYTLAGVLTPGAELYLSSTAPGNIGTAATTGGVLPCAYAVDGSRIYIYPPRALVGA